MKVICIDVGSIRRGKFAWASGVISSEGLASITRSKDISKLIETIASDLNQALKVALGFECPLFVPLSDEKEELTRARKDEGNRPWCAGAGCGALALGLTQSVWVLSELRRRLETEVPIFLDWSAFYEAQHGLFIWEAFVSGKAKGEDDMDDAERAVQCFAKAYPNPNEANAISESRVYSLIGAALLRSGWSKDLSLLSEPCLVIKA